MILTTSLVVLFGCASVMAIKQYRHYFKNNMYKHISNGYTIPTTKEECIAFGKLAYKCDVYFWHGIDGEPITRWWSEGWTTEYYNDNADTRKRMFPEDTDHWPYGSVPPEGMWNPEEYGIMKKLRG